MQQLLRRSLVCVRRDVGGRCRVLSTNKTHEALLLVNGVVSQRPADALGLERESRTPANLFKVVADDLLTLNHNLRFTEITEMIHNASLIHDDILDQSDMRREVVSQGPADALGLERESRIPSNLFKVVADDLLTLNHYLRSIVGAENPVLMSASDQIFRAGGKRMRPALVFLVSRATAELAGLKELTEKHRRFAEIIEMIHNASLIHDDIIDESDMRRGKETVHQLYGTRVAVLSGDFMFAKSSKCLADLENIEVIKLISQVIMDFADGEIQQESSLFDCDTKLEDYLIKSYCKTASLIAASSKGAAIFSSVDSSISEQMYEYGRNFGLSYQIVDDILDFTQSADQLGKPAGSDLAKGNLTAPVIIALEKEPKLRDIIKSKFCEDGSLEEAIELVKKCGGIERAQHLAREKADIAIRSLNCLPRSTFRSALEEMVLFNLERID